MSYEEPNIRMGITANMIRPIDNSWLYKDPDSTLEVLLQVYFEGNGPCEYHWRMYWVLGHESNGDMIIRIVHATSERDSKILTNWGPHTKCVHHISSNSESVLLGRLTLEQRRGLERIAKSEPTRTEDDQPNGNCQAWLTRVLTQAMDAGLMDRDICQDGLRYAKTIISSLHRSQGVKL